MLPAQEVSSLWFAVEAELEFIAGTCPSVHFRTLVCGNDWPMDSKPEFVGPDDYGKILDHAVIGVSLAVKCEHHLVKL
jgi:hypothetical protein